MTATPAAMFESQERGLPLYRRGKVRDVYRPSDEHLIIVACDRISAFDHVLPTPVPGKGRVLTQISNFFFGQTEHIIPNHIVDPNPGPRWYPELDWYYPELDGRTVLVRDGRGRWPSRRSCAAIWPVRGGRSINARAPCAASRCPRDFENRTGYRSRSSRLPRRRTPVTTRTSPLRSRRGWRDGKWRRKSVMPASPCMSSRPEHAYERGIIVADTKFEFGVLDDWLAHRHR